MALVTGANKGIGLAIARGLGEQGQTVWIGARDAGRGSAAADVLRGEGVDARPLILDVTSQASVESAAAEIEGACGRLDVLVNNAGIKLEFSPRPPTSVDVDLVRETYETNVFGTMRVILAMAKLLRAAKPPGARIVNLSSGLGSLGLASRPGSIWAQKPLLGYNTSKAAINSLSVQFANEFRDTGIKVNAADPGYVRTDMTKMDGQRTPELGAAVVIRLATLPDDGPTGCFFDENGEVPW